MRRTAVSHPLNLTMGENFRMRSLTDFAVNWVLNTISQHQELHSRMELLKGKTDLWRNWPEPC